MKAILAMNNTSFDGRRIKVTISKSKRHRPAPTEKRYLAEGKIISDKTSFQWKFDILRPNNTSSSTSSDTVTTASLKTMSGAKSLSNINSGKKRHQRPLHRHHCSGGGSG